MWSKKLCTPTPFQDLTKLPPYAFQFVFSHLEGIRGAFATLTLIRMSGTLLKFYTTFLLGEIITNIGSISVGTVFKWYLPLLFILFIIKETLDYFTRKYAEALPTVYGDHLQQRLWLSLFSIATPELFNYSKERLNGVFNKYVEHCRRFITDWIWNITSYSTSLLLISIVLFFQSPWILVVNTLYVVAFLAVAFRLSRHFSHLASSSSDAQLEASSLYQNALFNFNFLARLRSKSFILSRLTEKYARSWQCIAQVQSFHAYRWFIQLSIFNTLYVGTLCIGLYQVKQGTLPLGFLVLIKWSFDSLWSILVYSIEYYAQLVQQQEDSKILQRELATLQVRSENIEEKEDFTPLQQIEWHHVKISVGGPENRFVLEIPRLKVMQGEKIGIIGTSGSGKSTLFLTLLGIIRFEGEILWNNEALGRVERSISYLSPHDPLLKLSLRDNILLGRHVEQKEIERVLKGCCIDEFAQDLDAIVGSADFNLSTGQEQRVKLARTLLQSGECVLLDEPFNGIDGESKEKIKNFLKEYLSSSTVLISSHIADDLNWVNKVYVIDGGQLRDSHHNV